MSNVSIFTSPSCIWCKVAKEYFYANKIKFKELDVSQNHKTELNLLKVSEQNGVPVIVIGKDVIIGFNKLAIKKSLIDKGLL